MKDIEALQQQVFGQLRNTYSPEALRSVVSSLLEGIVHVPSHWAFSHSEYSFSLPIAMRLEEVLLQLKSGRPLQYVLGSVSFGDVQLHVDERALIPRPETEELLSRVDVPEQAVLLDACTGSGALALAFKRKQPCATVYACDISEPALALARENADNNHLEVNFFQIDILSSDWQAPQPLDVLVSNPPYVTFAEQKQMQDCVLDFEPHLALFVPDENPLIFYAALARWGKHLLRKGGMLWVEINSAFGNPCVELFSRKGFSEVTLYQDFFGRDRFVSAKNL